MQQTHLVPGTPHIALRRAGSGPLAVFMHGIGGNGNNWNAQLPAFAPHFSCAAWDARGYGASDDYVVILPYCRYIQDPIHLEIRTGHITKIEGGVDASLMREWLTEGETGPEDRDPYAISHLGWGLNPQCRWDSLALYGDPPECSRAAARSFPGNFLFSTGQNTQGGGKRTTRGHSNVPMRGFTIALDGNVIIDRGAIVDSNMKVARVVR